MTDYIMQDKVTINGIDVTQYRITWVGDFEWKNAIDNLVIDFSPSIKNAITLVSGMRIIITRGFVTSTDEYVLDGDITQIKPQVDRLSCVCKGRMIDAIKYGRTKSWDKDIDPEGGVGSEIFKSICTNSQLGYDSTTIPSTGTLPADLVVKFVQQDQDNFEMMNSLSETFERIIYYDYQTAKVNWQDKGFITYPKTLTVGDEIQNQIKWKENMEALINFVKVNGATVYDKINPGVFAGPATEFALTKTPEDTEVRQGSGTGTLYKRGQKGIGVIGTDFDYYVDTESKKLIFSSAMSNIWVRYGAQVPMPVTLRNQTSIDTYGGPNKVPHFQAFTFTDLKDVGDAEDRARTILNKYSLPFNETNELQITDSTISTYGVIRPGYLININDPFNNKNINVFVKIVTKAYPHLGDRLTVGDEIWRTEDWQSTQLKKINLLLANLNKNQDILISGIDIPCDINYKNRYVIQERRSISGDIGIYGSTRQGTYGAVKYGNYSSLSGFVLGSPLSGVLGQNVLGIGSMVWNTIRLIQGNNIYDEYVEDSIFYDSVNSTSITWNTTTKKISFLPNGTLYTTVIALGFTYSYATLSFGSAAGTYQVYISADGKNTWQLITPGTRTSLSSTDTNGVYLKILDLTPASFPITFPFLFATSTSIQNTYDSGNQYILPAIKLILEE